MEDRETSAAQEAKPSGRRRHHSSEPGESRFAAAAVSDALHAVGFWLAGAVALVSPWLFASWEMWWFWSVCTVLCVALAASGAATMLDEAYLRPNHQLDPHHRHVPARAVAFLASCAPFLVYALARAAHPSGRGSPIVAMESERSLLLFFTPLALGLVHLLSSRTVWRARLVRLLMADFVLVCACAVATHFANGDTQILWVAANDFHYVGRASAPYYCPNHFVDFAGAGMFVFLATALTPRVRLRTLLPALLGAAFCGWAAFLSLSRGGIASIAATLFLGVPLFAFLTRPAWVRALCAALVVAVVACGVTLVRTTDNALVERYSGNSVWKAWVSSENTSEFLDKFKDAFWFGFDRGQYIGSALRAWKSNPVWGIGPGQHSNRWAQFEASEDGVRPTLPDLSDMKLPRQRGYSKHLYEVHSDWTQLLEEYGIVGFALFLVPAICLALTLYHRIRTCSDGDARTIDRALPLGTLLVFFMLALHCVFDFSLQLPATVWLFATLASISVLSEGEAVA